MAVYDEGLLTVIPQMREHEYSWHLHLSDENENKNSIKCSIEFIVLHLPSCAQSQSDRDCRPLDLTSSSVVTEQ